MDIFYLQVHARPEEWHPAFDRLRGAYVSCWIKASSQADAQQIAYATIRGANWNIDKVVEPPAIASKPSDELLERWLQAQVDGECYVFHTYTGDAAEADLLTSMPRKSPRH